LIPRRFLHWSGTREIKQPSLGLLSRTPHILSNLQPNVPAKVIWKVLDIKAAGTLPRWYGLTKPLQNALKSGHKSSDRGYHLSLHAT